ncbi:hypothetical protein M405DRAFT_527867 [Rhizopogon salebrosus TDB-379]|nr:hypothetical protein M405DRAFT_527867 [Rhizopogon salebrosus TDB-379]
MTPKLTWCRICPTSRVPQFQSGLATNIGTSYRHCKPSSGSSLPGPSARLKTSMFNIHLVIPSNPSFEDLNNLFDPSHTRYLNRNALPTLTRLSSGLSTWIEVGRAPLPPKLQILRLSYPGYGIATSLGAMSCNTQ